MERESTVGVLPRGLASRCRRVELRQTRAHPAASKLRSSEPSWSGSPPSGRISPIGSAPPNVATGFVIREEAEEVTQRLATSILAIKPDGFASPIATPS
jgi:hypothetical protein